MKLSILGLTILLCLWLIVVTSAQSITTLQVNNAIYSTIPAGQAAYYQVTVNDAITSLSDFAFILQDNSTANPDAYISMTDANRYPSATINNGTMVSVKDYDSFLIRQSNGLVQGRTYYIAVVAVGTQAASFYLSASLTNRTTLTSGLVSSSVRVPAAGAGSLFYFNWQFPGARPWARDGYSYVFSYTADSGSDFTMARQYGGPALAYGHMYWNNQGSTVGDPNVGDANAYDRQFTPVPNPVFNSVLWQVNMDVSYVYATNQMVPVRLALFLPFSTTGGTFQISDVQSTYNVELPVTALTVGTTLSSQTITAGTSKRHSFNVSSSMARVTVTLTSTSGNADMYVSKYLKYNGVYKYPDSYKSDWRSYSTSSPESINFDWNDGVFVSSVSNTNVQIIPMDGVYYISVFGQTDSTYSIVVNVDTNGAPTYSGIEQLSANTPVTRDLPANGIHYFSYIVPSVTEYSDDVAFVIFENSALGDPNVFITTDRYNPRVSPATAMVNFTSPQNYDMYLMKKESSPLFADIGQRFFLAIVGNNYACRYTFTVSFTKRTAFPEGLNNAALVIPPSAAGSVYYVDWQFLPLSAVWARAGYSFVLAFTSNTTATTSALGGPVLVVAHYEYMEFPDTLADPFVGRNSAYNMRAVTVPNPTPSVTWAENLELSYNYGSNKRIPYRFLLFIPFDLPAGGLLKKSDVQTAMNVPLPYTNMTIGDTISAVTVPKSQAKFYRFTVAADVATITVSLTTSSGNADLYIAKSTYPDSRNAPWTSFASGSDSVTFNWQHKYFSPALVQTVSMAGDYYIQVLGQTDATFSIAVAVSTTGVPPFDPTALPPGMTRLYANQMVQTSITNPQIAYYAFTLNTTVTSTTDLAFVIVDNNPLADPNVYITTTLINGYPAANNSEITMIGVNDYDMRLIRQSTTPAAVQGVTYYIAVVPNNTAITDFRFTISLTNRHTLTTGLVNSSVTIPPSPAGSVFYIDWSFQSRQPWVREYYSFVIGYSTNENQQLPGSEYGGPVIIIGHYPWQNNGNYLEDPFVGSGNDWDMWVMPQPNPYRNGVVWTINKDMTYVYSQNQMVPYRFLLFLPFQTNGGTFSISSVQPTLNTDLPYTNLTSSVVLTDSVNAAAAKLFKFVVPATMASSRITVTLTSISGNPDLFIAYNYKYPDNYRHDWRSTEFGSDTITFDWTHPVFAASTGQVRTMAGEYYITVFGQQASQFSISLSISNPGAPAPASQFINVNQPFRGSLSANSGPLYLSFTLNDEITDNSDVAFVITDYSVSGNPDVYVSSDSSNPFPTASNNTFALTSIQDHDMRLLKLTSDPPAVRGATYYITIVNTVPVGFDFIFTISHTQRQSLPSGLFNNTLIIPPSVANQVYYINWQFLLQEQWERSYYNFALGFTTNQVSTVEAVRQGGPVLVAGHYPWRENPAYLEDPFVGSNENDWDMSIMPTPSKYPNGVVWVFENDMNYVWELNQWIPYRFLLYIPFDLPSGGLLSLSSVQPTRNLEMPKTPLMIGQTLTNQVLAAGNTHFFNFTLVNYGATVTVIVTSVSGNADVFVSKGKFPDNRAYDWASWKDTNAVDQVVFNWADKKFAPANIFNTTMDGDYTITVFAQTATVFNIQVLADYSNVPALGTELKTGGGSSSLSAGAVAGIVIGVVIGVAILVALVVCFVCGAGCRRQKADKTTSVEEAESANATHNYDEHHNEQSVNQVELSTIEN